MLGLDGRAARAAWTVFLMALAAAAVYLLRGTLVVVAAAVLLAYLLSPLVELVDRLAARWIPRNLSLVVVYVVLLAIGVGAAGLLVSRIVDEAGALTGKLPEYLKNVQVPRELPLPEFLKPLKAQIDAALWAQLESGATEFVPMLRHLALQILGALSNILFVVLVPILSFFFLKDGREFHRWFLDQLPEGGPRKLAADIFTDISLVLARYMRAIVLLALTTLVVFGVCFQIIGMPYAILLAALAAALEVIPVLGPISTGGAILLVAAFSGFGHLLPILIFLVVYRLFLDYVVQPYLMSSGVSLHPLLVIFGVLAGESLAGVAGMFLSIPVLAIARVLYVRLRARPAA